MPLQKELSLDTPFRDIRHETVLSIVRTASLLGNAGADVFRPFDLTEAQFNVLLVLKFKEHPLTQSDLGKRLVITRASVTSVLDRLEAKKLVERQDVPGNRRIFHVELTPKGRKLVEEVEPVYRQAIHRVLRGLNEKECRLLLSLLERVRGGVDRVYEESQD
jgi:MarR family 2-MHQ and catechol resistance regulon transcriptional repressor